MATNFVQPADVVEVASASTSSGDAVAVSGLVGVALTDTDDDGNIRMATEGAFDLSVTANDGSADTAVSVGDKIYIDGSGDLSIDSSGTLFGKALEAIASGETATIPVKIIQA